MYYIKITRDTRTGQITITQPTETSRRVEPYQMRRPVSGTVTTLQCFARRKDARAAYLLELAALELHDHPEDARRELQNHLRHLKIVYGMTRDGVANAMGVSPETLRSYTDIPNRLPSERLVVRIREFRKGVDDVAKKCAALLPESGSTGNHRRGRGGRKNIFNDAPNNPINIKLI
jgi:hypothetical protein